MRTILLLCLSVLSSLGFGQTNTTNPLLCYNNSPIAYDKINAAVIKEAADQVINQCDKKIKAIAGVPAGHQTVANILMAFDDLQYDLNDLSNKMYMIDNTYVDEKTRQEAHTQSDRLSAYLSNINLNEGLYQSITRFSRSASAKKLRPDEKKFLKETLESFEINGMRLDANGKKVLKAINEKVLKYGTQFDTNIYQAKDSISFTAAQLKGVPENISSAWKKSDGSYTVTIDEPNYNAVLKYADDENARRSMYLKYYNRAYPVNVRVLDSLLTYRQQLATLLGFKSYAEYALVQKMAKKPDNVWYFLDNLNSKLSPGVLKENHEFSQIKHQLHSELNDSVYAWDEAYYRNKLLDAKYQLNTDEVKEYFEMNSTIAGMFNLYEKLFNISIREVKSMPLWYSQVRSYELYADGKKMGTFFLDLYPRPNKYSHFETAPITLYHVQNHVEVLPSGALICNFPEGTATSPSLLSHLEVTVMFHEFGHLMAFLLCHPVISSQNSFAVKGDFIEGPSQFMENFCWQYSCLKLFAHHYKTGAVMPESLFNKMKKSQLSGSNALNLGTVYLSMLDFTYEDRYDMARQKGLENVARELCLLTHQYYPEGSHPIYNTAPLQDYGANLYGYLWSQVFAQDMFSVFEKNGVLNQQIGIKYRKDILEKGATEEEITLLKNFLGREPNSKAFLESLGVE